MKGIRAWALLALAVLAVGIAGCGGGGSDEATGQVPASPAGKAEAVNFNGVHSGEGELEFQVFRFKKKQHQQEEVTMRILGNFMKAGEEGLPQLDLAIESNGELAGTPIEFLSGPLLRADKWVFNFAGKVYEPDQATFEEVKSKLEEAQGEDESPGNAMACVEAGEGFKLTGILHQVSYEGESKNTEGEMVQTVGADLDVPAVIDEVIELTKHPACKAQLEAIGLPPVAELEALKKELEGSLVEAPRLALSFDKHGLFRYFKVLANVELPHDEELEFEVVMRLNRVNGVTSLPITHGYSPYSELLKQFGLTNEDVAQADGGEIFVSVLEVLANRLFGREGA